jgi:predicted permease
VSRLLQDVRYALRSFVKTPGFTAVAVIVLALGVGANTAIFTIVNALVFRPLAGQADELVGVYNFDRTVPDSYRAFSYPNYVDIREQSGVFQGLMAHMFAMVGTPAGDTTRRTFASVVSSNYFSALGVNLAAGRPFTLAEERPAARIPVVIVNYARWKEAGLDPNFLGRTSRINAQDFTVVGVAPEGFTGTMAMITPEMWLPLGMFDVVVNDRLKNTGTGLADRGNHALIIAGRTIPNVGDQVIQGRLDAMARQLAEAHPAENKNLALSFKPLPRLGTSTSPRSDDDALAALMGLFLALSGGVLVIACLNIANMLLARGTTRRKEVALRLALGAGRGRVIRQMLTESLMLAGAGAACGLLVSYASARALASSLLSVLPLALEFDPVPDRRVLLATVGFAFVSTLVFGLGPALKLSRRDLVTDLKDLGQDGGRGRRFGARNVLVVAQVALSLALLTAGGLFARASMLASASTPGFGYERVLMASFDPSMAGAGESRASEIQRDVLARVRRIPGVEAAGLSSTLPFGDFHEGERVRRVGGSNDGELPWATYRIISTGYFRSLGLSLVRGRDFTEEEERSPQAPRVAIVDMALARKVFGDDDPLGQSIVVVKRQRLGGATAEEPFLVVGIAPPVREEVIDPGPTEHFYVPSGRHPRGEMHLTVRAAQAASEASLLQSIRRELRAADPQLPVLALKTMQRFHESSLGLWMLRAGGYMFTLLGVLALVLAVVGVYGVRAYVVAQRTREFGIRMALGADASRVRWLVLREGLMVAAAGVLLGMPLALAAAQVMISIMNRIGGFDPIVFTVAPLALALATLAASYLPARRATTIAPLIALRSE